MRQITRALLALTVAVVLFAGAALPARAAAQEGFTISNYDVRVTVSEDNVYDVTETIDVDYAQQMHGIKRSIPFRGTMTRESAQAGAVENRFRVRITDVDVEGAPFDTETDGDDFIIKIGDPDRLVDGRQTYRIHYQMRWPNDGIPQFDEVYYNLVGTGWDTTIDHVAFSVALPKPFDVSALGFSMGQGASRGYDPAALSFTVNEAGNTVVGETRRPLANNEALTMRVELPQGYFQVPAETNAVDWLLLGLMVAMAALGAALFVLFGRDARPVRTVEFYAPDGLTPAEVGYVLDGDVANKDVIALILHWAHRGYLTIEDLGDDQFRFTKRKAAGPEMVSFEQFMFNKMFAKGDVVDMDDLKYTFYQTIETTKSMVVNSFAGAARRVFTGKSLALRALLSFLAALPVLAALALTQYRATLDEGEALIVAVLIGALVLLPVFFLIGTVKAWNGLKPASRTARVIACLLLGAAALGLFLVVSADALLPALPWVAAGATVVLGVCAAFMGKRTARGTEWLGKILGFKDFITEAERDKLERLVAEDPGYFYGVLPYAYVLGITDKWAKNFEQLAVQPPQWYVGGYGGGYFSPVLFAGSLNRSLAGMQSGMTARPPSSGSGGGGGGGFSGGGFAGGGGGGGGGSGW